MTGLDRILSQISYESKTAADALLAEAQKQADAILKEAEEQGRAEAQRIAQQSAGQVQDAIARAESAAALQKKKAVLAEKQEIISGFLAKALESLHTMPAEEYFALIEKMVRKYALPEAGEVYFSAADLARLPKDFEKTLNQGAPKGAGLKISAETRPIDGGFVLGYGGIEENCSFEALFDSAKETLQDKVHDLLFS